MKTIWINAGELSGDMQAAALLTALREREPELAAIGMGGPNLARAGQKNLFRVESLSVMGIMEVLTALPRALHMLSRIKKEMARLRPDAVVLVDAPEFNFRVAKIAHGLGIPVYYFIPPKIWAWRTGRVRFLQRYVKRLFCILPFEPAFYAKHGVQVDYIGNPLVDMVNWPELKKIEPIKGRIGLMPGSRRKEVEEKGQPADFATVLADIRQRDYQDTHRAIAPLKQADDAILVDTSDIGFDESFELLKRTILAHI